MEIIIACGPKIPKVGEVRKVIMMTKEESPRLSDVRRRSEFELVRCKP